MRGLVGLVGGSVDLEMRHRVMILVYELEIAWEMNTTGFIDYAGEDVSILKSKYQNIEF